MEKEYILKLRLDPERFEEFKKVLATKQVSLEAAFNDLMTWVIDEDYMDYVPCPKAREELRKNDEEIKNNPNLKSYTAKEVIEYLDNL